MKNAFVRTLSASLLRRLTAASAMCSLSVPGAVGADTKARRESPPNVVVILADDLGYGSLNSYGADKKLLATPNLDRLATEGRRFTDASAPSSVCSPTRYALMTGRYVWRTGERSGVYGVMDPLKIETGRATLASVLKGVGYATAVIGKWHLGFGEAEKVDYTRPLRPGSLDLGFDHSFLVAQNHGDVTGVYLEDDKVAGLRSDGFKPAGNSSYGPPYLGLDAPQRQNEDAMEVLTDQALSWIGQPRAGQPFFLYFSPVAVHEPITPSNQATGKTACGPYCDFIVDLDLSVGRILGELDRRGMARNTVVLFTSDNGGELAGPKSAQRKAAEAGLSLNGRWRGGKHNVWEGGLRVPYIVRWPGKVPAGTVTDQMVNLVDTMATLSALTGARMPDETVAAEDSVNVLPAWRGTASEPVRKAMMTNSEDGVFSLRQGSWKWIEGAPDPTLKFGPEHPRAAEFQPQLYNLQDDPGETRNVMGLYPEVTRTMARLLDECRFGGHSRTRLTAAAEKTAARKGK